MYAKVKCQGIDIPLPLAFNLIGNPGIQRETLGTIVVIFDLASIAALTIYLWLIPQYIKVDAERHRNLLFETKEFALEFDNLPKIS